MRRFRVWPIAGGGGGTYTPKQQNWRWYADDGAEPTAALANENTRPTLDNENIIRLRVCIAETGGKADSSVTISVEYSTDDSTFIAFGAANHWNYANGQATEGNLVTTNKLTDATTKNEYCESGTNVVGIAASTTNELDIAIQPVAGNYSSNTTYYFRVLGDGTVIPLNTGETHPQVLTPAVAYSLNAEPGSFALTGFATGLIGDRVINAEPAAFSLTGFAATLQKGFFINAEPGSFVFTGAAAGLLATRLMNAEPGNFTFTGADGVLAAGRVINAEPGNFVLTGVAATLAAGRAMNAEPGSFVLTGADAGLLATRLINAEPGSFALTGFAATLVAGRVLNAEPGSFALAGADAGLLAARLMDAGPGSFVFTGADATLVAARMMNAESASFIVTGADATLTYGGGAVAVSDYFIQRKRL